MRGERWGDDATQQHLVWHHRRDDVGIPLRIDCLVTHARDAKYDLRCTTVRKLARLVPAVMRDLPLVDERLEPPIAKLQALRRQRQVC